MTCPLVTVAKASLAVVLVADPNNGEFVEIFQAGEGTRPVMSKPRPFKATKKFAQYVQENLGIPDDRKYEAADWVAHLMERYAAAYAKPVFDMEGNGPVCSMCSMIWPFCGHHHMSAELDEQEEPDE